MNDFRHKDLPSALEDKNSSDSNSLEELDCEEEYEENIEENNNEFDIYLTETNDKSFKNYIKSTQIQIEKYYRL